MKKYQVIQKTAKVVENHHLDFEHFFSTYYPILFKVGYRLCADKELTKDLLQSFFLELWESRFQSRNIQYLEAYLTKAFYRKVVKAVQDQQRTHTFLKDNLPALKEPSYEELLVNLQASEVLQTRLQKAIQALPPQQRTVLDLRFKNGLDYEEIASTTGKSQQTIYNQVHGAIQKLRKVFKG